MEKVKTIKLRPKEKALTIALVGEGDVLIRVDGKDYYRTFLSPEWSQSSNINIENQGQTPVDIEILSDGQVKGRLNLVDPFNNHYPILF